MTSSIYDIEDVLHNDGVVTSINVNTNGSGYTTADVSLTGGNPTISATAEAVIGGSIQSVDVGDHGSANHTIGKTSATANRGGGPSGINATLNPRIFGLLKIGNSNINIVKGGTNYGASTQVTISAPNLNSGRQAIAFVSSFEAGIIDAIQISEAGTGYTEIPTITLSNTSGGSGAIVTIRNVVGGINDIQVANDTVPSGLTINLAGTNYINGEIVILEGATSGNRSAYGIATVSSGSVTEISVTTAGNNYTSGESLKILGIDSGAVNATTNTITTDTNAGGTNYEHDKTTIVISSDGTGAKASTNIIGKIEKINVTNGGQGYDNAPIVTITGDGTGATATAIISKINADENILVDDISITSEMVSPGGGGILRLYFSFDFDVTPAIVSVFNNNVTKGNLNADNSSDIVSNGYYRFDLDVKSGDMINFQSSEDIDEIHFIRTHLIQFGA